MTTTEYPRTIGYAYLDMDKRMNFKPKEYIAVENPGFWQQNQAYIVKVWPIDTDDIRDMHYIFTQLRDSYKLDSSRLIDFANCINFDMNRLGQYKRDNQIQ